METWIIITIVIVVLAALGAAGGLTYFYIQRRSQRRASDEYTKSLIDEALLAENLAKQQQTVTDLQATISNSNTQTGEEQKTATLQLAGSQKELEQLKNNITLAVQATNSLSRAKSAIDNNKYIEAAQNATAAELKALEDKKKAADKTTVDALNFTTSELEKQAANLKKFKESLQADTLKLAAEVGNPSIIPPVLPDSSKPSIRIAWDAAADKVATSDDRDFAIKQLSEIYMITGADAADLKKEADKLNAEPTVCERIKKIQFDNNLYGCPSRWTVFGEQCYRGPCENSPSPPAPKPPTPPTPKPPPPDDGKKAFGDNIEEAYGLYKKERDAGKTVATAVKTLQDKYTGVGPASTKILEDRYIASKPPAPKPPPPKPPTPKPPPPKPPTDLEKKYPYWGWGPNEGLRCANKDNTGCNTAYDANGNLYDTNPTPKPPPPSDKVISTLDIRSLTKGGGSWNIKKYKLLKSNITQFQGHDVVRCWYGKNSGTSANPGIGGFSFEADPQNMNRDAIVFSWEVYYPKGFQFARGGKFGGVGVGYGAASGGHFSTTGASNRVMWQSDGGLIAYVYPPSGLPQKAPGLSAGDGYGTGFFNKELAKTLKLDAWNKIELGTKLNTFKNGVPQADGETSVTINGKRMVQGGINWRKSEDLKISRFDIGTFFGGPLPSPVDQECYFKNFQMSKY